MKTKSLIILLCISGLCLHLWSCTEKNPEPEPGTPNPPAQEQLPPITTTGAGTFGCKVNGKVWVAKSNIAWPKVYFSIDKNDSNNVGINGYIRNNNTNFLQVSLRWYYTGTSSTFKLGYSNANTPKAGYFDLNDNIFWETDSVRGGQAVILRFDSVNQIISGTFHFDCINKETGEIIKITDGRFDGHYTY